MDDVFTVYQFNFISTQWTRVSVLQQCQKIAFDLLRINYLYMRGRFQEASEGYTMPPFYFALLIAVIIFEELLCKNNQ